MSAPRQRWQFEKLGLGYRLYHKTSEGEVADMKVSRLKRSSDGLHAEIQVSTNLSDFKTNDGLLHVARFNLSSSTARQTLAKLLKSRTPVQHADMDWFDGLETLCQNVLVAESKGQPIVRIGQQQKREVSSSYAIDPLAPNRVASLLYGPGGSGKSVLALALAMSIQAGRTIVPGLAPGLKGNVIYLDWETDEDVINDRIQAIASGAAMTPPAIHYRRCRRALADDAMELADQFSDLSIVYAVIDSAGMAMGSMGEYGDANESTLRLFEAVRLLNVPVQIIDHVAKQEIRGKGPRFPYGSVYKINLARSAWEMRQADDDDNEERIRVALIHAKANDSRLRKPIGIGIQWGEGKITFRSEGVEDIVPDQRSSIADRVADLLMRGKRMTSRDIADYLEANHETVRKALQRGEKLGIYAHYPSGLWGTTENVP